MVTTQLDAGFDLSMFNNRLMVTADYFNRLTDNLIYLKGCTYRRPFFRREDEYRQGAFLWFRPFGRSAAIS